MQIIIDDAGDGTYTVTVSNDEDSSDAGDPASATGANAQMQQSPDENEANENQPQQFNSVQEVIKFVQQELTEESGESPNSMWASESQSRDPTTGIMKPGAKKKLSMSM